MAVKKILFVCSIYKPNIGGVEIVIEHTTKHLHKKGVEVAVLTKKFPHDLSTFEIIDDTPVVRIKRPVTDTEFVSSMEEILNHEQTLKSDIVHVVGIRRPMPLFALLLARRWNVPCVVTFAGGDLPQADNPESQNIWAEGLDTVKDSVSQADRWTAFASNTAELAQRIFSTITSPSVILGGVNLELIHAANPHTNQNPYFFAARRLEHSKGIDILIKAFAKISTKLPSYELIIAGDGAERDGLENLAKSLLVNVKFIGVMDQVTVFRYMKGAVAHICPSRSESGGLVNYEAQAAECIAIGSDVGGIPEYIKNGQTGLLFKSEDVDDLADKLIMAASHGDEIKIIKRSALEESNRHGWNTFTDTYLDIYREVNDQHQLTPFNSWSKLTKELSQKVLN